MPNAWAEKAWFEQYCVEDDFPSQNGTLTLLKRGRGPPKDSK